MLLRNIAFEMISRVVVLAAAFAFIPFVIGRLGLSTYGFWEFVTAIATFGNLLYATLAGTILWKVAGSPVHARGATAWRLGWVGATVSLASAVVVGALVWLGRGTLSAWVTRKFGDAGLTSGPMPAIALAIVLQGMAGTGDCLGAGLSGLGLARYQSMVRVSCVLLNYVVSMVSLAAGWGVESLLFGMGAMSVVQLCANGFLLAKVTRGADAVTPDRARLSGRPTMRYAGGLALGQFAAIVKDNGDRFLCTLLASPDFTALLGVANRLNVLIGEINRYTFTPLIPAVGHARAAGDHARVEAVFERALVLNAVATGMLGCAVVGNGRFILGFWIGLSTPLALKILSIVTFGTIAQLMLTGPATAVCRGIGKPRYETIYVVAAMILNLAASPLFIWWGGGIGKVIATAGALCASSLLFVWLVTRSGTLSSRPFKPCVGLALGALVVGNVAAFVLAPLVDVGGRTGNLLALLVGMPLVSIAYLAGAAILSPSVRTHGRWMMRRMDVERRLGIQLPCIHE